MLKQVSADANASEKTSGKGVIKTGETEARIKTTEASPDVKTYITPVGNTFEF